MSYYNTCTKRKIECFTAQLIDLKAKYTLLKLIKGAHPICGTTFK